MILSLFRNKKPSAPVFAVYNAIVAQSRQPRLYADWGVPDTVTGRFDMISLHISLLFRRLRSRSGAEHDFSQQVFDLFFKDMDRSLREMGSADLGVPKRIQKMGTLFYGMLANLSQALDSGDVAAVEAVLVRNVYGGEAAPGARALAEYAKLKLQSVDAMVGGTVLLGEAA